MIIARNRKVPLPAVSAFFNDDWSVNTNKNLSLFLSTVESVGGLLQEPGS